MTSAIPQEGQLVEVRRKKFIVNSVEKSELPKDILKDPITKEYHIVDLRPIEEEDSLGLSVYWEIEPGARVLEKGTFPKFDKLDDPEIFDSFLNAIQWGTIASSNPNLLYSPFRSGIKIENYQLDPLIRALKMPRVNLLIGDDVGLGKTIETGLIIQELILRNRIRTVLIVCPPALQIQWKEQMRDKFGLEFRIVDSDSLKELRKSRGIQVNPWNHFPRLITSIDYIKRENPFRLFKELLPKDMEITFPRKFDLLVVDEAHEISPSGKGNYATDSQRTTVIRSIAQHFEHKIFLSATPHNGYQESFTGLLEILDNQRFARKIEPEQNQLKVIMVRRLKKELSNDWNGESRFPERRIEPIEIDYTTEETLLHELLERYTKLKLEKSISESDKNIAYFVLKLLKKRLFSSPRAFLTTLEKQIHKIHKKERPKKKLDVEILNKRIWQIEDQEDNYDNEEELEETADEVLEECIYQTEEFSKEEIQILNDMHRLASQFSERYDSKAKAFIHWLQNKIKPQGKFLDKRVIIFTEYRTTQKWLLGLIENNQLSPKNGIELMYGGMDDKDRERIKNNFQTDVTLSPIRILLATDAASQGIDLQNQCSDLLHYDIPWNPNRLEQRNGRIDRHGQKEKFVSIYHFVPKGFKEDLKEQIGVSVKDLKGELEFLGRIFKKVEEIRSDLGTVGQVISDQVNEVMIGKRSSLDYTKYNDKITLSKKTIQFQKNLQEELKKCFESYESTKTELKLEPENIAKIVQFGLKLAGQPMLKEENRNGTKVYHVPSFSAGSWSACSEGLYHPVTNQKRPIVFDPYMAKNREDVVLAHLNHRLVRMSIAQVRSEIWAPEKHRKIFRATTKVANIHSNSPIAIVYGRLVVVGQSYEKLHEEFFYTGGKIEDKKIKNLLKEEELKNYLSKAEPKLADKKVHDSILKIWNDLSGSLENILEKKTKEKQKQIEKNLSKIESLEKENITNILNDLKKNIENFIADQELDDSSFQLSFSFTEKEQWKKDKENLENRLKEIPAELEKELERISKKFSSPHSIVLPIAVEFLVPKGMV